MVADRHVHVRILIPIEFDLNQFSQVFCNLLEGRVPETQNLVGRDGRVCANDTHAVVLGPLQMGFHNVVSQI